MDKKNSSYLFSADVIRTVAIVGVVVIHTANSVVDRPDFFGGISWFFALILNSISRICIPLFVMLSGYFILRKDTNFNEIFKKIGGRLLVPLVFWSTINTFLGFRKSISSVFTPSFILSFFSGNVSYLYFLVILIGLYFVAPLFRSYLKNNNINSQKYLAIFFMIIGMGKIAVDYLVRSCITVTSFTMWVPYVGFFIAGYLIFTQKIKFKNNHLKLSYILGFLLTVIFSYIYYFQSKQIGPEIPVGCITHYSDYYLSINVVLMSISAFALLTKIDYTFIQKTFLGDLIYKIARSSFGIYLIHLFIVNLWDKQLSWNVDNISYPLWLYIIFKFFGVFIVSYILTEIINKIPFVKKIIGE